MPYEKSIPQNDSVFRAHNECMKECHEETGALRSYLAKKEQQHRTTTLLSGDVKINQHSKIFRFKNVDEVQISTAMKSLKKSM